VVLLVRALALEYDIAGDAVFDGEAEFGLVEHVLLWSEVNQDGLRQQFSLLRVSSHRRHMKTLRHLAQGQTLTAQGSLHYSLPFVSSALTLDRLNSNTSGSSTLLLFSSSHLVVV
jgi:hypothetical protein